MPELNFEGTATWNGSTECSLSVKGKNIVSVSPPPSFGGKAGYCTPEDIFAAALASCINTLFMLIAKNSQLTLKNLETKATVKMNVEGMEKAETVYGMAQKICPIRQSWGEAVPISFDLNFL
jgi:organic hydroperoxide reductase OsmC/OhrA